MKLHLFPSQLHRRQFYMHRTHREANYAMPSILIFLSLLLLLVDEQLRGGLEEGSTQDNSRVKLMLMSIAPILFSSSSILCCLDSVSRLLRAFEGKEVFVRGRLAGVGDRRRG